MTQTNTEFELNDAVVVQPGLPDAKDLEGRVGTVVGFETAGQQWVVVLFDRMFSGRPDRGWLFTAAHLAHADQAQQAA